ncbi:hypothetical protein [Tsukamurella sp. NPDC003166]|uniref:hypothetical protein n=1 Tax=Tsukamurella sp. NPDC003166 TaxID=3154444 RepID=UPI0033A411E3
MTYHDPGRPAAPRPGGFGQPHRGPRPQAAPYGGHPQQPAQPYPGYPQQTSPAQFHQGAPVPFQQAPAGLSQPFPAGPAPQPPAPGNTGGAARTAGRALGATGRAVGGFFEVLGILLYHLIWGGIAVAGVALTGTFGPVALLATLVGAVVLILYWTTGWQIWFF